jgi:hypothetical protein
MKVNITLELDDRDRYVIAKYFGVADTRAKRRLCRDFIRGALRTAVRENADALRGRQRAAAKRLAEGRPPAKDAELAAPRDKQLSLLNGAQ